MLWVKTVERFPLPVGRGLWSVVVGERGTDEGVWFDQVCCCSVALVDWVDD